MSSTTNVCGCDEGSYREVCDCRYFDSDQLRRDSRGHRLHDEWRRMGFYDSIFENSKWWKDPLVIKMSKESGLWGDTPVVFAHFDRYIWYHLSLSPRQFADFAAKFKEMDEELIDENLATLPHWCVCEHLCDLTVHRHSIVAVRPQFKCKFEETCERGNKRREVWIEYRRIRNRMQMAKLLQHVGGIETPDSNHEPYCVNRPLYPHAFLGMLTLFEGGLKNFSKRATNCVVPVRRDFEPVSVYLRKRDPIRKTFVLFVSEDTELIFRKKTKEDSCGDRESWWKDQLLSGNSLFFNHRELCDKSSSYSKRHKDRDDDPLTVEQKEWRNSRKDVRNR